MKTLWPALLILSTVAVAAPLTDRDLAIGHDMRTHRPNVFIAWRNSQRILEVEVEVKNLGDRQATGDLSLAVLDEEGRVLASNEPQTVTLPPRGKGGSDGTIVQVKGNLELNLLIDKLDRANAPYLLRAAIASLQPDADPLNNSIVKTFNVPSRVRSNSTHFQEFAYNNDRGETIDVVWNVDAVNAPDGWTVGGSVQRGTRTRLAAGELFSGHLSVTTPSGIQEGQHVDLRLEARDASTGELVFQYEWYAVCDTVAPAITEMNYKLTETMGELRLTSTVDDASSMLKEASGVRVEYSTDGGITFSDRIMAYTAGNFVGPTSFGTTLGPFEAGTTVEGSVIATDIAGNRSEAAFGPVTITAPSIAQR